MEAAHVPPLSASSSQSLEISTPDTISESNNTDNYLKRIDAIEVKFNDLTKRLADAESRVKTTMDNADKTMTFTWAVLFAVIFVLLGIIIDFVLNNHSRFEWIIERIETQIPSQLNVKYQEDVAPALRDIDKRMFLLEQDIRNLQPKK